MFNNGMRSVDLYTHLDRCMREDIPITIDGQSVKVIAIGYGPSSDDPIEIRIVPCHD